jgi:hypothetical protein
MHFVYMHLDAYHLYKRPDMRGWQQLACKSAGCPDSEESGTPGATELRL